jgi:beta-N-acetylhexosaminidase
MAAITARMSIADAVEATLVAGADNALWISSDAVPQVLDRLEQSVASGKLPADRVDTSVLRMARYKGVALGC